MGDKTIKIILGTVTLLTIFFIIGYFGQLRQSPKTKPFYQDQNEEFKKIAETIEKLNRDTGDCSFATKGLQKSAGINIEIFVPCRWKEYDAIQATVVKQFGHDISDNESIGVTLDISPLSFELTDEWIQKFTSESFIKQSTERSEGKYVSSRKIKLNNIKGNEVVVKKYSNDIHMYILQNNLFYKNAVITLNYHAAATTQEKANKLFSYKKGVFYDLLNKTIFN